MSQAERPKTFYIMSALSYSDFYTNIPSVVLNEITASMGNMWKNFYPEKSKRSFVSENFMQMKNLKSYFILRAGRYHFSYTKPIKCIFFNNGKIFS